jgi:hypothetical protein
MSGDAVSARARHAFERAVLREREAMVLHNISAWRADTAATDHERAARDEADGVRKDKLLRRAEADRARAERARERAAHARQRLVAEGVSLDD